MLAFWGICRSSNSCHGCCKVAIRVSTPEFLWRGTVPQSCEEPKSESKGSPVYAGVFAAFAAHLLRSYRTCVVEKEDGLLTSSIVGGYWSYKVSNKCVTKPIRGKRSRYMQRLSSGSIAVETASYDVFLHHTPVTAVVHGTPLLQVPDDRWT